MSDDTDRYGQPMPSTVAVVVSLIFFGLGFTLALIALYISVRSLL